MVFNWFRRQFSDRPDESQKTEPEPTSAQPPAETPPAAAEESPPAPAPKEDYLQWAKAAYQNIQQQQVKETAPETEAEAETEAAPEASEAEVTTPTEEIEPETVASAAEAEEMARPTADAVQPETVAEVAETAPEVEETQPEIVETAPEVEEIQPEIVETAPEVEETQPEVEQTPAAAETVDESAPIWARGLAERQARIDRLKETAIEEPEPEPEPAAASAAAAVEFDEMFMWSAGVLANQGRRPDEVAVEEITWLQKLWKGLGRTRRNLLNQLKAIVGAGPLNQEAVEEIEALLLQADVGVEATEVIIEALQDKLREEALPPEDAIAYLKQVLRDLLEKPYQNGHSPSFAPEKDQLNIWLITGVNGAGKTTTIGKIAHIARKSDYRTLIAAGDTFRAAAVEQVKVWGDRSGVEVIANPGKNTDPAAVVFDAVAAARSRDTELLIIDTAGRLQNKKNLMEELNKIRRVIDKKASDAVVESLLVLDATLGQNGLRQAQVFAEVAQLSGVVLTKLDGTAKGGVALAVVQQLGLPIRFIGVGESIEDLRPFSSYEFIEALLSG
ncbi:signal recognition particle-docking protein FtsY [Lyngbya sp. CCY1209]|uniref:signal recognition particle-docking protein FtsY n=1 Tax=Lyngbya sp. CCY1209 TaxID=2886103 RepID=UPI002D212DEA|nr:signal recognition particle-docking protein FtsY [Lyngbya sp. CCY1209]MEB3883661.1 signal recognition particle-docking protein FtsY [Lyngbya sp. CCY1209]